MVLEQVIGLDLGGTSIKLGRFDRQGQCLQGLVVPTPQPAYPEAVLAAMVEAIAQLDPDNQCCAIGVGTPGPADADGRIARVAINLAGWQNIPLADWLEEKTGKPAILANDANCAGLGEYWLGAGRSFQNLILLTLGTGVGGAVVLNGELFVGRGGTGAELGLITLNPDGPDCNSGNQGSLEQYTSIQAIRRRTGLEPEELGNRARVGDPEAIAFWEEYGRDLGAGIASLVYVLTPEAVIIGGGISASAEFFFPSLRLELEKRVLPSSREGLQLLRAELGNQAGIVGAAKLAWQRVDQAGAIASQPPSPPSSNPPSDRPSHLQTESQNWHLAYQMAEEMAQFKAGFLARTAHELRSPINSVISLHQLILADLSDSPEEEREFVAQASAAAKKMLGLMDELIHVSKVEHGSIPLQIQPICLIDVLCQVYQLTILQAKNRNIQLDIEFPDPDLMVWADLHWLQQAILSLIDTPLSMMQEGFIRVTTEPSPTGEEIHILIEDQRPAGVWQEPITEMQDLLAQTPLSVSHFDSKTRVAEVVAELSQSISRGRSPSLSLFISKTLIELMKGRLELLSIPDLDAALDHPDSPMTRIRCSFPVATPEATS